MAILPCGEPVGVEEVGWEVAGWMQWQREEYAIDTNRQRLDMASITAWLQGTYWAATRPVEDMERSWENSAVVAGVYKGEEPVGFARVVSDLATVAYLADVFIVPEHRGRGLGKWLVESLLSHPYLRGVKWLLHTRDAHGLYRQFGFQAAPVSFLERPRR